jgi:hypothetical protein
VEPPLIPYKKVNQGLPWYDKVHSGLLTHLKSWGFEIVMWDFVFPGVPPRNVEIIFLDLEDA